MEDVTIGLAFIAGLLSFVSPCVLPLVPAYVGYMGGRASRNVALETAGKQKTGVAKTSRMTMLIHGLAFVAGFTTVFVVFGVMTTALAQALQGVVPVMTEIIARAGGVIIILFGLHFMGALRNFFSWLKKNPHLLAETPFGGFLALVGVIAALVVSWLVILPIAKDALIFIPPTQLEILLGFVYLLVILGIGWQMQRGAFARFSHLFNTLGTVPTTFIVALLGSLLIVWAFVGSLVSLIPLAAFVLWLYIGNAFTHPQAFWLRTIDRIDLMLYTDTRPDMDGNQKGGLGGSFLMGVVFSAGWTPCIGPLYGAILAMGLDTGNALLVAPMLAAYSLGLGIPFLLTAGLLEGAQSILRRLQRYMGQIEIASGVLLIAIGALVISGNLQALSQSLTPEQADMSIRIEECGVRFFSGELNFDQSRECLDGTLHIIDLNRGTGVTLESADTTLSYLFTIEESFTVEVQLYNLDAPFDVNAVLTDMAGNIVAESNTLVQIEDDEYLAMMAIALDDAGQYTLTINQTGTEEVKFRMRIREAQDHDLDYSESLDSSGVGSITDLAADSGPAIGLNVGNRAPDFTTTLITGETVSLSDLQGKVVLINFWGTWCAPCIREMPDLQSVYAERGGDEFTILALAVNDNLEAVEAFQVEHGITFPLALDEGDQISMDYAIIGQPTNIILNQEGVIIYKANGIITEEIVGEILNEALDS